MRRSLDRAPAPLFSELEESEQLAITAPEQIGGCIRQVIEAHRRLVALLEQAPVRSTKAILLEQARWSAESFTDQIEIQLQRHRSAAWAEK